MFKILDWYIGRTIVATTALVLVTFVGLSGIIKYVEQLRKVGEGSYDLLQALLFVVLSIPRDVEMFFPMAALLGALIGLGALASSSELVVMQAAGFSKLDIGLSVLKTAIPLMIIVTLLGEWGHHKRKNWHVICVHLPPRVVRLCRCVQGFGRGMRMILSLSPKLKTNSCMD
ncbi:Permease [Vibrio cholerae]|nr:Permease [Vibrio cholerae]